MRLAGLSKIECQLEPDVAGSGVIDTNQDIAECHALLPVSAAKIRLGDTCRKPLVPR